eukprot:CAMPEP_0172205702 /NCGR_PEP_ID=MMETSP1050-20130122/32768_1 /TAXON_ID=233186 /ORGANISM="Cryptomonas curvata, Strain CCAP979/52" /LENGTH=122 /DNA_ID=CAMNT_0012884621 /DNA_START=41 /DNA_END=406 /DNA_ORIENTATION=-
MALTAASVDLTLSHSTASTARCATGEQRDGAPAAALPDAAAERAGCAGGTPIVVLIVSIGSTPVACETIVDGLAAAAAQTSADCTVFSVLVASRPTARIARAPCSKVSLTMSTGIMSLIACR